MKKLIFLLILCGCASPQVPNLNYNCTEVIYKAINTQKCEVVLGLRGKYDHAWLECNGNTLDLLGNERDYTYTTILKGEQALKLVEIEQKYHAMGYDATIIYDGKKCVVIYKNKGTEGWRIHQFKP